MTHIELNHDALLTLVRLGLTLRQAKVFSALFNSGNSTVGEIAENSNVPRPDLYRILDELMEMGLVEKIIAAPSQFQAISMQESVSSLLKHKIKETDELRQRVEDLLHRFEKVKMPTPDEKDKFILIPGREGFATKRKKSIAAAQTSIDVVATWKRLSTAIFTHREELRKAAEKGIQIRYVTEKPEDEKSLARVKEIEQTFKKYPFVQFRYICFSPTSIVVVIDKKEVFVITAPQLSLDESPALWSNNRSLIELAENYFEMMWTQSLEHKNEEQ